jgi:hypothetical protein
MNIISQMSSLALAGGLLLFTYASVMVAQTPQSTSQPKEPEAGVDDDPTRAVFFSIREEYRNLRGGAWNNRLVLRKDAVALRGKRLGGRGGFLLRTDIPITTTHLGSETHNGLGDIYAQALYIPYVRGRFAFVAGTGVILPTATHKTLGLGKWQVAPLAVPTWFLLRKKGYFFVKFQDSISIAGAGGRAGVHALFINPSFTFIPAKRWAVQAEAETRTNWQNDHRTDFRVGFGAGKVVSHRLFLAIKCEVPIGPTRQGNWTLKVVNIFYRR